MKAKEILCPKCKSKEIIKRGLMLELIHRGYEE